MYCVQIYLAVQLLHGGKITNWPASRCTLEGTSGSLFKMKRALGGGGSLPPARERGITPNWEM